MTLAASLPDLISNTIFVGSHGNYRCVCELRRGGMGLVLLAEEASETGEPLHQPAQHVALKINQRTDEHARKRMEQEIASLKALNNEQVVSVLDSGIESGYSWYAMDYVGSCNLGDILLVRREGVPSDLPSIILGIVEGDFGIVPSEERIGLPISTALTLIIEVAQVVSHAHQHGVLHRDLKPANILLNNSGTPILCDFGVARARNLDFNLTAVDEVVGTLDYIAPEQLAGEQVDERSDIYSIGVMLFECLTGQLPSRRSHGWDPFPELRILPKPLQAILWSALHPDPKYRPASASALAKELQRFHQGQRVLARGIRWYHSPFVLCYRYPMAAGVLLVVCLLICLVGLGVYGGIRQQAVQWSNSVDVITPGILAGESRTALFDPTWQTDAQTKSSMVAGYPRFNQEDRPSGHVAIGIELPPRSSQRVSAVVDTRSGSQEVSLFLSQSAEDWEEGYLFQVGAYNNTCAILSRGRNILWVGPYRVIPNQRLEIALYRIGDKVHAYVNGVQVLEQIDTLPFYARSGGAFTYLNNGQFYPDPPRYKQISLESALLSDFVPSEYLLSTYALSSDRLGYGGNRILAQAALNQGQALLEQVEVSDPRYARLSLRQEMIKHGLQHDVLQDLYPFRERLKHNADFHLHQMKVHEYSSSKLKTILSEAVDDLNENELKRMLMGISHDLTADVRVLLYEDMVNISQPFPIVKAFIVWRHMLLVPELIPDFSVYWRSVSDLMAMDEKTWFRAYATEHNKSRVKWELLRQTGSLEQSEAYFDPKPSSFLEEFMEGKSYEKISQLNAEPLKSILEIEGKGIESDVFVMNYSDRNYYKYDALLSTDRKIGSIPHADELLYKHFAVAILLAPNNKRLHQAIPYYTDNDEIAFLELYLALAIREGNSENIFVGYQETPVAEVIQWLQYGDISNPPPHDLPLSSAAGPILKLATALRYHQAGFTDKAMKQVHQLAAGRPWLPATQAAKAIMQWGFPP